MNNYLMYSDLFDPYKNLALETGIMNRCDKGDMYLYLWQNRHTVVIGRNQNAWRECRCELLRDEGGTLARRTSGGGAVYHDLGNLNYTFIASPERYDIESQLSLISDTLKSIGIVTEFTGRNDMTIDGRKFSGSAYKHTKTMSMHHGTLLVNADIDMMTRYLRPSELKLKAKGVESVRSRVCNLSEYCKSLTISALKRLIAAAYAKSVGGFDEISANVIDTGDIYALYSSWDWNMGMTPKFDVSIKTRFSWGEVEICLALKNGKVDTVKCFSDAMDENISEKIESALCGAGYGREIIEKLKFNPDIADWLEKELPL